MFSKLEKGLSRFLCNVKSGCRGCKASRTKSSDTIEVKGTTFEVNCHLASLSQLCAQQNIRVTNDLRLISNFYEFEGDVLGRGRFGETRIVVHKQTRERFACKSIHKEDLHFVADLESLKREIDFLKLFKGFDSIASFHDVFEDAIAVHIILELCTGGELFNRILEKKRFPEHEAAMMMRSILSTVSLCHDHYIVHSDLKPENFIFSHVGPGSKLKAIDFGISQFCPEGKKLHDLVGTVSYMAPEVLMKDYSFPADIWSCGVILYILICGEPPFYGKSKEDVAKAILYWDVDFSFHPWPSVSPSLKKCIKKMLDRNPNTRAAARDILFSEWMVEQRAAPLDPIPNALYSKLAEFSRYNLLKKLTLKLIADALPDTENLALYALFHQLKRNESQTISVTDLQNALLNKGVSVQKVDLVQLVRSIDISGSEQISSLDFIAANMRLGQLASNENLEFAFDQIDQDSNTYITIDELQAFLSRYCAPYEPSEDEVRSIIMATDINCDGYIDFNEFRALMKGSF